MPSTEYILQELAAKCGVLAGAGSPNSSSAPAVLNAPRGRTLYERTDVAPHTLWFRPATSGAWIEVGSGGAGGGLADAPSDGQVYARQDGAWAVVAGGGGTVHEWDLTPTSVPPELVESDILSGVGIDNFGTVIEGVLELESPAGAYNDYAAAEFGVLPATGQVYFRWQTNANALVVPDSWATVQHLLFIGGCAGSGTLMLECKSVGGLKLLDGGTVDAGFSAGDELLVTYDGVTGEVGLYTARVSLPAYAVVASGLPIVMSFGLTVGAEAGSQASSTVTVDLSTSLLSAPEGYEPMTVQGPSQLPPGPLADGDWLMAINDGAYAGVEYREGDGALVVNAESGVLWSQKQRLLKSQLTGLWDLLDTTDTTPPTWVPVPGAAYPSWPFNTEGDTLSVYHNDPAYRFYMAKVEAGFCQGMAESAWIAVVPSPVGDVPSQMFLLADPVEGFGYGPDCLYLTLDADGLVLRGKLGTDLPNVVIDPDHAMDAPFLVGVEATTGELTIVTWAGTFTPGGYASQPGYKPCFIAILGGEASELTVRFSTTEGETAGLTPPEGHAPWVSTNGTTPNGAEPGDLYEIVGDGGHYDGQTFEAGDMAIIRSDRVSVTRLPKAHASGGGGGGGASIVWSTITGPASVAASVSGSYLCDASSGAITVTLPDTASEGDEVVVAAMAEAPLYPVTLSGGGVALMDQPEDLVLNLPQTEFRCIRRADPYGWHIIASGVSLTPINSGGIESIVAGANVTVDNTDPANPIVSATGGGGGMVKAEWPLIVDSTPLVLAYTPVTGWLAAREAGSMTADTVTAEAATDDGYGDYLGAYAGALGALPDGKTYFWLNLTDGEASEAHPSFNIGDYALVDESSGASDAGAPFLLQAISSTWYAVVDHGSTPIAPLVPGQPILVEVDTKAETCTIKAEGEGSVTFECPGIAGKSMFMGLAVRSTTVGEMASYRLSSADAMGSLLEADAGFVPLRNYQAQLPVDVAAPALLTVTGETPVRYDGTWYCADYSEDYDPATMTSEAILWNDEGRVLPLPRQHAVGTKNGGPTTLTRDTTVNVPADYATLDAAITYAKTLVPLNGARLTIEVDESVALTEQHDIGAADLSFVRIVGLGDGPTITWSEWYANGETTIGPYPCWISIDGGALGPVLGVFRGSGLESNPSCILANDSGRSQFGEIDEATSFPTFFLSESILGTAQHVTLGVVSTALVYGIMAWEGTRVFAAGSSWVGKCAFAGDADILYGAFTPSAVADSQYHAIDVAGGRVRFVDTAVNGMLSISDARVSGTLSALNEPATGFPDLLVCRFLGTSNSDVDLTVTTVTPLAGCDTRFLVADGGRTRVRYTGGAIPETSTKLAVDVYSGAIVQMDSTTKAALVASFTLGLSQAELIPTADGLILA